MGKKGGGITGRITSNTGGTFSASSLEGVIVERIVTITGRREQRDNGSRRD